MGEKKIKVAFILGGDTIEEGDRLLVKDMVGTYNEIIRSKWVDEISPSLVHICLDGEWLVFNSLIVLEIIKKEVLE